MILPTKHIPQDRALLTVGGRVLTLLGHPKTVSALWDELNRHGGTLAANLPRKITYDWFLLVLDLLYALGTIDLESGLVSRRSA